jgi:K+-transporting ATPase KdpF subunit
MAMNGWEWVGLAVCLALFVYLLVALLRPEVFD